MEHKQTTSSLEECALDKCAVLPGHYLNFIPVTLSHLVLSGYRRAINDPPVKNPRHFHNHLKKDGGNF